MKGCCGLLILQFVVDSLVLLECWNNLEYNPTSIDGIFEASGLLDEGESKLYICQNVRLTNYTNYTKNYKNKLFYTAIFFLKIALLFAIRFTWKDLIPFVFLQQLQSLSCFFQQKNPLTERPTAGRLWFSVFRLCKLCCGTLWLGTSLYQVIGRCPIVMTKNNQKSSWSWFLRCSFVCDKCRIQNAGVFMWFEDSREWGFHRDN